MTLTVTNSQIATMSRREREQYIRETLAFDGPAEIISEYFYLANMVDMFGDEFDLSPEDLEILRDTARQMFS